VRQNFKPVVRHARDDRARATALLGTHVFTAEADKNDPNVLRWSVVVAAGFRHAMPRGARMSAPRAPPQWSRVHHPCRHQSRWPAPKRPGRGARPHHHSPGSDGGASSRRSPPAARSWCPIRASTRAKTGEGTDFNRFRCGSSGRGIAFSSESGMPVRVKENASKTKKVRAPGFLLKKPGALC